MLRFMPFIFMLRCTLFLLLFSFCTCPLSDLERVLLMKIPWRYQSHDEHLNSNDENFFSTINSISKSAPVLKTRSIRQPKRREYLCLSDHERWAFHRGLVTMKRTQAGEHNEYDIFVLFHDAQRAPTAHHGPSFILWHRFYLLMLELSVQKYSKASMVPYWDNRLISRSGPNPRKSVYFNEELMGNAYGPVRTGFAANFITPNSSTCRDISKVLVRAIPRRLDGLFKEDFVNFLKGCSDYKSLCLPWNSTFESVHGLMHVFVGELMSYLACAPCDPLFFLHHAFVDYLYEEHFRKKHKNPSTDLKYPDVRNQADDLKWYGGEHIMMPFGIRHRDMLLNEMFVPHYDRSPGDVKCHRHEDCCSNGNTRFLWCNTHTNLCAAKMVEGGRVRRGSPDAACYCRAGLIPLVWRRVCRCRRE